MKVDKKPPVKDVKKATEVIDKKYDLIKTINENDEVEDLSEESDVEVEVCFELKSRLWESFDNPLSRFSINPPN